MKPTEISFNEFMDIMRNSIMVHYVVYTDGVPKQRLGKFRMLSENNGFQLKSINPQDPVSEFKEEWSPRVIKQAQIFMLQDVVGITHSVLPLSAMN